MNNTLLATAKSVVGNAVETATQTAVETSPYISSDVASSLNQNVYEPNVFGVICSLLIVLALIYATSFFYQKLIKFNSKINNNDVPEGKNEFKILSGATLGQGKYLHVVEINETYLVLGSTPNNITLLKEYKKSDISKNVPLGGKNEES